MLENKYPIMESVKPIECLSYLENLTGNFSEIDDKIQKMLEFSSAIAKIEDAVEAKLKEVNNA